MGFLAVLGNVPNILQARKHLMRELHDASALICIDSSSFHAPVLQAAKESGIPSIAISSPQVWAWRKNRIPKITQSMTALFCLFDFEPSLYPTEFNAIWQGHPIIDRFQKRTKTKKNLFGLLPGSRPQEINRHLPIFLRVAKLIRQQIPNATFLCATPTKCPTLPPWVQSTSGGAGAMKNCQAVLSKSGTCTLELALQGIPMVVAHQINPIIYPFLQSMIDTPFIALPNILSKQQVVPEFIQHLDEECLAQTLMESAEQSIDLSSLGSAGAASRIAAEIHRMIYV